jgi:HK97 family phage prohead protease
MSAGDGRTVDVRIVPYGERATAMDGLGGVPKRRPVPGGVDAGAFDQSGARREPRPRELRAPARDRRCRRPRPHACATGDGFYGSFKLHDTPDGDKALMLVKEGVLAGVSLEARPVKSIRTAAGVVQRVKAHLKAIALCREPAFTSAQVLAIRTAPVFDEEMLPVDIDPELVARCRRLGIRLPQRMQAHPDDTDTPANAGTSDDGTRHTESTSSSEV